MLIWACLCDVKTGLMTMVLVQCEKISLCHGNEYFMLVCEHAYNTYTQLDDDVFSPVYKKASLCRANEYCMLICEHTYNMYTQLVYACMHVCIYVCIPVLLPASVGTYHTKPQPWRILPESEAPETKRSPASVCVCVCMCVSMCVYVCVGMYVCIVTWNRAKSCKCACVCMCVCVSMYVCIYVCIGTWNRAKSCKFVFQRAFTQQVCIYVCFIQQVCIYVCVRVCVWERMYVCI
jgi:hypothetical protein